MFVKRQSIVIFLLFLLFLATLSTLLKFVETNSEKSVQTILDSELSKIETYYKVLIYNQETIAGVAYEETMQNEAFMKIFKDANIAKQENNHVRLDMLRQKAIKLLDAKYKLYRKSGVFQYHFVFPDNKVFLRMHKKDKHSDDLTDIREDFAYVNETLKTLSGFEQGRTAHAFRNVYPVLGENSKHIGAMEVSFSSEILQSFFTKINSIHTHFLVNKHIFLTKSWDRSDLMIDYKTSSESSEYMLAMEGEHTYEKCIVQNKKRLASKKEEIANMLQKGKKFAINNIYNAKSVVVSFYPIYEPLDGDLGAWIVSYNDSPLIDQLLKRKDNLRVLIFVFVVVVFSFIYFILNQKETLKQKVRDKTNELEELNENLENKVELQTKDLKDSEFRWKFAVDGSGDGLWDWNLKTNDVYFSPRWKAMLGFNDDEILNNIDEWTKRVHPDDLENVYKDINKHLDGKTQQYENEHRVLCKDGSYKWVLDRGIIVQRDDNSEPLRMIGTHTDIDGRKKTEIEIQRANIKLSSLFNSSLDPIVLVDLETQKFTEANPKACEQYGYTKEEFFNLGIKDIEALHNEQKILQIQENIVQAGWDQFESKHKLKDGTIIDVLVNAVAIELFETKYLYASFRDITQQKELLNRISYIKERLELTIDAVNDGIWEWDVQTDQAYFSIAWKSMLGYDEDEIKNEGKAFFELVHDDDKQRVQEIIKKHIQDPKTYPYNIEVRLRCKDGSFKWVLSRGKNYFDKEDNKTKFIGTHTDITKQKEIEKELIDSKQKAQKANEAKSEFLANMSHEIRTPLNGIIGLTDIVLSTQLNDQQKDYLSKAKQSSYSLLNIINDILDYSKIEAGKLDMLKEKFYLNDVINNISNLFDYKVKEKGLEFNFSIDPKIDHVLIGDSLRISQVLNNFMGNAIKFTHKGFVQLDVVLLDKTDKTMKIEFMVKDSGIGIAKENQEKLFKAFNQEDTSTTKKYGGTGLGLAISKQLVKLMDGEIGFVSQKDKGSTFKFVVELQYDQEMSQSFDQQSVKSNAQQSLKLKDAKSALVVEDNKTNQIVAKGILENIGFVVDIANDGIDGVQKAQNDSYDIIFMDLQMPNMDGFEASKKIREFDTKTPIVALSAAVMSKDKELTKDAGMNDHLSKPIVYEKLAEVIENHFDIMHIDSLKNKHSENFDLQHIDIDELLERIDNNEELAKKLLLQFYENYKDTAVVLKELELESKEFDDMLHSLKGVSGNLSMTKLYESAKAIYENKSYEFRLNSIEQLLDELNKVLEELEDLHEDKTDTMQKIHQDKEVVVEIIDEFIKKFTNGSYISDEKAKKLYDHLMQIDEKMVEKLKSLIGSYNYKEAKKILEDIKGNLH